MVDHEPGQNKDKTIKYVDRKVFRSKILNTLKITKVNKETQGPFNTFSG